MSPLTFIFALLTLAASARTRVPVAGQPVPVLWLLAAVAALACAAGVLIIARLLLLDGLRLRPGATA